MVVTGGGSAAHLYPAIATLDKDWSGIDVLFSDERSVPATDGDSNYGLVKRLLFEARPPRRVHRMRGEDPPAAAAKAYEQETSGIIERGMDIALLGMGEDCHIAALFPGSPALEAAGYCASVHRPDGMEGITLTPRALLRAGRIYLIVTGAAKAEAVERAVRGGENPRECPVKVLATHPAAKFLLDKPAAARL
jgi:6-phosphogluconolactonase